MGIICSYIHSQLRWDWTIHSCRHHTEFHLLPPDMSTALHTHHTQLQPQHPLNHHTHTLWMAWKKSNHQISYSSCMSTHQRPVRRTQQRDWRQFLCIPLWLHQEPVSRGDKLPVDCFLHWLPSGHSRHSLTWSLAGEVAAKDEVKTDTRYTQTHIVTLKQSAT